MDNDCDGVIDEDLACECVDVEDVSLKPLKNDGDWEFNGNGPDTTVTVFVTRTSTSITVHSCVKMVETVPSGGTTGEACSSQTVPVENVGLVGDSFFEVKYLDTDYSWDDAIAEAYHLDDSPLVAGVLCIGDTFGADLCGSEPPDCATCVLSLGCVPVQVGSMM